jgi:hypothetical protein
MSTPSPIPNEVLQPLREHIDFVVRSSDAHDVGYFSEAKRFAVAMRALFHDAPPFRSLFMQAEGVHGNFISTLLPPGTDGIDRYGGLIRAAKLNGRSHHYAPLDWAWYSRWLPLSDWWSEPVFVDEARRQLTRRDVVLTVASKDGGANVDASLSMLYARLLGYNPSATAESTGEAITSQERAAIRQIVHEALRTLFPTYRKMPKAETDARLAAAVLKANEAPAFLAAPPSYRRNEACPCGNGKKVKYCHGAI